ncbi:MAG: RNA polymerase sigma factor [Xanthomonadaceae bacterium]|nr:RNA polymerase sigma factor [Xanthomonadaceae bacterium]
MNDNKRIYTALVRPHISALQRVAWRWTRDRQAAEDLVQDVLLKVVDHIAEMRTIEQLRPWLVKIMYRRFVDLYRRDTRSPVDRAVEADPDRAAGPDPIEAFEWQQLLAGALAQLEPDHRDVILLHDVEGYTGPEVAEILEINEGTVKSRLHRARERLKNLIDPGTF